MTPSATFNELFHRAFDWSVSDRTWWCYLLTTGEEGEHRTHNQPYDDEPLRLSAISPTSTAADTLVGVVFEKVSTGDLPVEKVGYAHRTASRAQGDEGRAPLPYDLFRAELGFPRPTRSELVW